MSNDHNDKKHLHTMSTFDITIAGEINLDLILYGLPRQMPVERELIARGFQARLGSSSAILAHNQRGISLCLAFLRTHNFPRGRTQGLHK